MKKIVVFEQKHGNLYYDASTDDLLERALLTVLRDLYEMGWFIEPQPPVVTDDLRAYISMDGEEVAALPEGLRKVVEKAGERYRIENREYREFKDEWDSISLLVKLSFEDALKLRAADGRSSLIEHVMSNRKDHTYEHWHVTTLGAVPGV